MTLPNDPQPQPVSPIPLALDLAPPERPKNLIFIVILCGLASTMAALLGVWAMRKYAEEDIMGWYANHIVPAGAMIVGVVAGVGYGVSSWLTGVKIRKGLLLSILGLQFGAYWAAKYIDFALMGRMFVAYDASGQPVPPSATYPGHQVGFFEFYHIDTITMTFTSTRSSSSTSSTPEPLGGWGYAFRFLEILGFLGGSFIVPVIMAAKPYCDICQVYKRKHAVARLPASLTQKEVKAGDIRQMPDGTVQTSQGLSEQATLTLAQLQYAIAQGDIDGFRTAVVALLPTAKDKKVDALPSRMHIDITFCPNCNYGVLHPFAISGKGQHIVRTPLPESEIPRPMLMAVLPILRGKKA